MKKLSGWIIGLHLFIGIGAIAGGSAAVLNPESPFGVPSEMLRNSPFSNYLIPGLFLLTFLGAGNLLASLLIFRKANPGGIFSGMLGICLILWILIQCYVLQSIGVLHIVFFLLGVIQALLAFVLLYKQNRFPANLLERYVQRLRNREK